MKRVLSFVCGLLPLFSSGSAYAVVWPMEMGQDWVYEAYDSQGNVVPSAEEHAVVNSIVTRGSEHYYNFGSVGNLIWDSTHFRSTDTEIYEWDDSTNDHELFFVTGAAGDTWLHGTNNTVEILDTDFMVDIPYGLQNYSSYQLKFSDPSGEWYIYVVPGLGVVQNDERLDTDTPDYIYKLKSIDRPIIPAPGAILLGAIGAGLVGWMRRRNTL